MPNFVHTRTVCQGRKRRKNGRVVGGEERRKTVKENLLVCSGISLILKYLI